MFLDVHAVILEVVVDADWSDTIVFSWWLVDRLFEPRVKVQHLVCNERNTQQMSVSIFSNTLSTATGITKLRTPVSLDRRWRQGEEERAVGGKEKAVKKEPEVIDDESDKLLLKSIRLLRGESAKILRFFVLWLYC